MQLLLDQGVDDGVDVSLTSLTAYRQRTRGGTRFATSPQKYHGIYFSVERIQQGESGGVKQNRRARECNGEGAGKMGGFVNPPELRAVDITMLG